MASHLFPIDVDVDIETLRDLLRKHRPYLWHLRKGVLDLLGQLLDSVHIRPLHVPTKRRFDAGQFHVQPVFNAHRPGAREPGNCSFSSIC